jgi:hypothetical protein
MMSKRILALFAALFTALLVLASPAQAGNPHFIKNATSASLSGTSLVVKFKEAGLPSGATETVTVSATLSATYQCVNNGGKNPNDPKKTTINTAVSTSGEFKADKNGNITGSLTLSAPAAATVLDCPSGQRATLTVVSYTAISITDDDSGATLAIPGTFSSGTPIN